MITNADIGVLLTWEADFGPYCSSASGYPFVCSNNVESMSAFGVATTSGSSLASWNPVNIPGQASLITPVLQAQDGTYFGTVDTKMISFDGAGNVRWTVPNDSPQIATSDGGVIGSSGVSYDHEGKAAGQLATMPTYSWKGAYELGSIESWSIPWPDLATTLANIAGGNFTGNGTAAPTHQIGLVWCDNGVCDTSHRITYSYAPAPLDPGNPGVLINFGNSHPDWVALIKQEGFNALKEAFDGLPVVVSLGRHEHTAYVIGDMPPNGPDHPCAYTAAASNATSYTYYLVNMEQAQVATGGYVNKVWQNLSPAYPPTTTQQLDSFASLAKAIGKGIGYNSAHEIGHQFSLPKMDCHVNTVNQISCDKEDPHVLEYYSCKGDADYQYAGEWRYFGQRLYIDPPLKWGDTNTKNLNVQLNKK